MKVILLAGGFGSRLAEYTDVIPKPMVPVGGKPILWHIMQTYACFGHKDFYVALGYKAEVIKEYFLNYRALNADFTVDLASGNVTPHQVDPVDWKVTLVDTGENTMTGGRLKRVKEYIKNEKAFCLTYGDGLSNINITELIKFHKAQKTKATLTAVIPPGRFGAVDIQLNKVKSFREKPAGDGSMINGGFFVLSPSIIDYISNSQTSLEREPLERLSDEGTLSAYQHKGFWHSMDTLRDKIYLEELWTSGKAPWKVWN